MSFIKLMPSINQSIKFSFIEKKENPSDTDANGIYNWGRLLKLM